MEADCNKSDGKTSPSTMTFLINLYTSKNHKSQCVISEAHFQLKNFEFTWINKWFWNIFWLKSIKKKLVFLRQMCSNIIRSYYIDFKIYASMYFRKLFYFFPIDYAIYVQKNKFEAICLYYFNFFNTIYFSYRAIVCIRRCWL